MMVMMKSSEMPVFKAILKSTIDLKRFLRGLFNGYNELDKGYEFRWWTHPKRFYY